MDGLQDIIGVVMACAAAMAFAMMIWAGQHQS
jgi:threonine/homoserine efflux transporter RhtA